MSNRLMSTEDVAKFLGMPYATVLKWRQDGVGPEYTALNKRTIVYQEVDVEAWAEEHKVEKITYEP